MNASGKWLIPAAVCLLAAQSGLCGEKFASMDLEKVLKEYNKTKPAEIEIDRQKTDFKAEIEQMSKRLEELVSKYEIARKEAQNKALNDEALKAKLEQAEKKQIAVKEYEMEIRKAIESGKKRIFEETLRIRNQFTGDILAVVRKYADDKGIQMVVDSSSPIPELRGAVIYRDDSVDITSAIIRILNEGAGGKSGSKK